MNRNHTACQKLRQTSIVKLIAGFLLMTFLACGLLVSSATASERSSLQPMYRVSANEGAQEATRIYAEAVALRKDVRSLTNKYIRDYGDRLSPSDRVKLRDAQKEADRQLSRIVMASKKYRNAVRAGAKRYKVNRARRNLADAWSQGKKQSEISGKAVRQILEPELSLLEKLSALNDYNEQMARFDDLGDLIRDLPRALG